MNLREKLSFIQSKLVAPKSQYNSFGRYNYRSCEDILEAVKPLLKETKCSLTISDAIELYGDKTYVAATATLYDCESEDSIFNKAYAREPETKKGQDDSQITGSTSSYARKYALNGLFCIDDTKDADATNTHGNDIQKASPKQVEFLASKYTGANLTKLLKANNIEKLEDLSMNKASELIKALSK